MLVVVQVTAHLVQFGNHYIILILTLWITRIHTQKGSIAIELRINQDLARQGAQTLPMIVLLGIIILLYYIDMIALFEYLSQI